LSLHRLDPHSLLAARLVPEVLVDPQLESHSLINTVERSKAASISGASGYMAFDPTCTEPTRYTTLFSDEAFQKSAFFAGAGAGACAASSPVINRGTRYLFTTPPL
jgi:hypothetical protein